MKRFLEGSFATILLLILFFPLFLLIILAAIDCKSNGIFEQKRIGKNGVSFSLFKLQTIHSEKKIISGFGNMLRNYKLDEIPQLLNIVLGDMSFVGPRPDIPGYADQLKGPDLIILSLKPGITGLASLKYRNEEKLLNQQVDPEFYNDNVIWPDKVRINKWYANHSSYLLDLKILLLTFFPFLPYSVEQIIKKEN